MGGGFALLRWVGAWGGPHPLQKRDFPPFAVGGMRETKINPSSRIPLTADEGKISLLRWVAAASCIPPPPTAKGGTYPPWGMGPPTWWAEPNFPTAKNKRPPPATSRRF